MVKFKVNDKVRVNMGDGFPREGIVLMNDLKGRWPVLIKVEGPEGDELCLQTPMDGAGKIFPIEDAKEKYVSYIFSDGTATPLRRGDTASPNGKKAVAVVTAYRDEEGKYYNYKFISFEDADETADESPAEPPSLAEVLESLFGKRK